MCEVLTASYDQAHKIYKRHAAVTKSKVSYIPVEVVSLIRCFSDPFSLPLTLARMKVALVVLVAVTFALSVNAKALRLRPSLRIPQQVVSVSDNVGDIWSDCSKQDSLHSTHLALFAIPGIITATS